MEWETPSGCVCESDLKGNVLQFVDSTLYSPVRLSPLDRDNCSGVYTTNLDKVCLNNDAPSIIKIRSPTTDDLCRISFVADQFGNYPYTPYDFKILEECLPGNKQKNFFLLPSRRISPLVSILLMKVQKAIGKLTLIDLNTAKLEAYHDSCLGIGSTLPVEFSSTRCTKTTVMFITNKRPLKYPGVNVGCIPINYELQGNKICFYKSGTELISICHMNPVFEWKQGENLYWFFILLLREFQDSQVPPDINLLLGNEHTDTENDKHLLEIAHIRKQLIKAHKALGKRYLNKKVIPQDQRIPPTLCRFIPEIPSCGCLLCDRDELSAERVVSQDFIPLSLAVSFNLHDDNKPPEKTINICSVFSEGLEDFDSIEKYIDEANFEQEDPGVITDLKPSDVGLPGFPQCPDPSDRNDQIVREWRAHVKLDLIPAEVKEKFVTLLDKNTELYAYDKLDYKYVLDGDKEALFDLDLSVNHPIFTKAFPLSGPMLNILETKIDELLDANMIKQVDSQWNSPLFLVPHNSAQKLLPPDKRKYRIVVDLRVVNSVVRNAERYSSLVKGVETSLERLRDKKYFTTLDMNSAYRSIKATDKAMKICAFTVPNSIKYPFQSFAFTSLIDGITTGVNLYSYYLQKALSPESRKCSLNHVDDLCIFSETLEQHLKDIEVVFRDLKKSRFMISIQKAEFFKTNVRYLGHRVSYNTISIEDSRRSSFKDLTPPKTKKELMRFLGMVNYISSFIDSHQLLAAPLYNALTKRQASNQKFTLNEEQLKAFEELKLAVDRAPDLTIVDLRKPVYLDVDASMIGSGCCLYHREEDSNGKEVRKIIKYGSKRFSAQIVCSYNSIEKEGLAIVYGIKQMHFYLFNAVEVVIRTDMKSLLSILSCYHSSLNQRLARVSHFLYSLPFKWSLNHVSGEKNQFADCLSRIVPDYRAAFSNRIDSFPDLKREMAKLPAEWLKTPNIILTTRDIMQTLRDSIDNEKCSEAVRAKRYRGLTENIEKIMDQPLIPPSHGFNYDTDSKLTTCMAMNLRNKRVIGTHDMFDPVPEQHEGDIDITQQIYDDKNVKISPSAIRALITPAFLSRYQNKDPALHKIIMTLKTSSFKDIPKRITKQYRLLNDSILVTRYTKQKAFYYPGNLRIICTLEMALIILAYLHVMNIHPGVNSLMKLFLANYKIPHITALAKIIVRGCRACKLNTQSSRPNFPPGRVPLQTAPNKLWFIDHMSITDIQFRGQKVRMLFNVMDGYSGFLASFMNKRETAQCVLSSLQEAIALMGLPEAILSDNHSALLKNRKVIKYLQSQGIKTRLSIPYNSQSNRVERLHSTLRRAIKLTSETFARDPYDIFYQIIQMINSRPLAISHHPAIKDLIGKLDRVVTPYDLQFSRPRDPPIIRKLSDDCSDDDFEQFQAKWTALLTEYNKQQDDALKAKIKIYKQQEQRDLHIGSLAYTIRTYKPHKEKLKYNRNIYEIVDIAHSMFFLRPLFGKQSIVKVHGNKIKPYHYSSLFEILPKPLRLLLGENLSPDALKARSARNRMDLPNDLDPRDLLKYKQDQIKTKLAPSSVESFESVSSWLSDIPEDPPSDPDDSPESISLDLVPDHDPLPTQQNDVAATVTPGFQELNLFMNYPTPSELQYSSRKISQPTVPSSVDISFDPPDESLNLTLSSSIPLPSSSFSPRGGTTADADDASKTTTENEKQNTSSPSSIVDKALPPTPEKFLRQEESRIVKDILDKVASARDMNRLRQIKNLQKELGLTKEQKTSTTDIQEDKNKMKDPENTKQVRFMDKIDKQKTIAIDQEGYRYRRTSKGLHERINKIPDKTQQTSRQDQDQGLRRSQRIRDRQNAKRDSEIRIIRSLTKEERENLRNNPEFKQKLKIANDWRQIRDLDRKLDKQIDSKKEQVKLIKRLDHDKFLRKISKK